MHFQGLRRLSTLWLKFRAHGHHQIRFPPQRCFGRPSLQPPSPHFPWVCGCGSSAIVCLNDPVLISAGFDEQCREDACSPMVVAWAMSTTRMLFWNLDAVVFCTDCDVEARIIMSLGAASRVSPVMWFASLSLDASDALSLPSPVGQWSLMAHCLERVEEMHDLEIQEVLCFIKLCFPSTEQVHSMYTVPMVFGLWPLVQSEGWKLIHHMLVEQVFQRLIGQGRAVFYLLLSVTFVVL